MDKEPGDSDSCDAQAKRVCQWLLLASNPKGHCFKT